MNPFAHTFSIIARDPETGQFGVGVQSHWFSVGAVVPWVRRGIGAVATQAHADTSYGQLGLELMSAGKTAQQALAALTAADPDHEIRQVAMIDREGQIAVHTGARCIKYASHISGEQFSVQGNLLTNDTVIPKMAEAYQKARGDFSERLLQTLEAAQDAGGDVRGKQSAALLVAPGPDDPLDRLSVTDLRVDDSSQPLRRLRRLLTIQRGYEWHTQAIHALETGDLKAARSHYANLRGLAVGTREPQFWYAVKLAELGYVEESLPIFREVFTVEPVWQTLIERLAISGDFPANPGLIAQVKALKDSPGEKAVSETKPETGS